MNINLHITRGEFVPKFFPYLLDYSHRWEFWCGSAGSGKSYFLTQRAIIRCCNEKIRFVEENLRVVLGGIAVANKKGNDYIPHADFALQDVVAEMVAKGDLPAGISAVEVGRDDALKFLAKEPVVLENASIGYVLLVYCGMPLGFVKNLGNRTNNLLPMARRIRMSVR